MAKQMANKAILVQANSSLGYKCALLVLLLVACSSQSWPRDARPMNKKIDNGMTLEQIDHAARAALPQGTPLAEVDRYLMDNHVEHSFHRPTNQVFAAIRNIKGGFFPISKDVQIIITLDKAERLATLEVKAVLTGP
jgi:hypothetical protein